MARARGRPCQCSIVTEARKLTPMVLAVIATLAVAIWLYLAFAHGGFWLCSEREEGGPTQFPAWPSVAVVIPARNEADCIPESIGSLLAQDYPGVWSVILVDDESTDGTAAAARAAAAAGGCMLIRSEVLRQAGGLEAIRGALIDDCALAKLIKARGPIWLGLTDRVRSIRRYAHVRDIRQMVARSAYAQLRYSPLLLAGAVAGMALTYLVPPLMALFGSGSARVMGLWAWCVMAVVFQPTLRLYRLSPLWGLALPVIALCYMLFTLDSALQFARGRGGLWKGRIQASGS